MTMCSNQVSGTGFTVNNYSYESPTVPILLQILSGVPVGDLLPKGSIYPLSRGQSVELYIPAGVRGGPVSPTLIMSLELYMTLS